MSNTDFLSRAIDVVKKAIEQDTNNEYEKAYQLYYQACGSLFTEGQY
jgi:vacuolar protein-sorting-associated protein 4